MKLIILLSALVGFGLTNAQIPGFGGCPDWVSQADFDMNKFLGTWYEAERYVNIFEAGTRCVKTNYTKAVDGRYLVANEIMNRFTSVKRVLEGEIRLVVKGPESTQLNVKYPNLPIPYESQFIVLDTDYNSYAVMWSCSSLGIINTQNAWILTREKLPHGTTFQKAYGVLDRYRLSRTFFIKIDQNSCEIAEAEAATTPSSSSSSSTEHGGNAAGSKKPPKKNGPKKNGQTNAGRGEDNVAVISKPVETKPIIETVAVDSKKPASIQQQQQSTTSPHQLVQKRQPRPTTQSSPFTNTQNIVSVSTAQTTAAVVGHQTEKKTEKPNNRETDKRN